MNLIERYIYAVISRLPNKHKKDIANELRTLISDMVNEIENDISDEDKIKQVLLELGDPNAFAEKYNENRYLISPRNFGSYLFTLKLVFIVIFLAVTLGSLVDGFLTSTKPLTIISTYLNDIIYGLLQGFAWVTIAFALIEYKGIRLYKAEKWSLKKLPHLPNKKKKYPHFEFIINIMALTLFMIIFYFYPQIIAIYLKNGNASLHIIPVFNLDVYNKMKFLVLGLFIINLIKAVHKLIYNNQLDLKSAIYDSILQIISMIIFIIMFIDTKIYNPNFINDFNKYTGRHINIDANIHDFIHGLISIIILLNVISIGFTLFKALKYKDIPVIRYDKNKRN